MSQRKRKVAHVGPKSVGSHKKERLLVERPPPKQCLCCGVEWPSGKSNSALQTSEGYFKVRLPTVPRNASMDHHHTTQFYKSLTNHEISVFTTRNKNALAAMHSKNDVKYEAYFEQFLHDNNRRYICSWHFDPAYIDKKQLCLKLDGAAVRNPHVHVLTNFELVAKGLPVHNEIDPRQQRVIDRDARDAVSLAEVTRRNGSAQRRLTTLLATEQKLKEAEQKLLEKETAYTDLLDSFNELKIQDTKRKEEVLQLRDAKPQTQPFVRHTIFDDAKDTPSLRRRIKSFIGLTSVAAFAMFYTAIFSLVCDICGCDAKKCAEEGLTSHLYYLSRHKKDIKKKKKKSTSPLKKPQPMKLEPIDQLFMVLYMLRTGNSGRVTATTFGIGEATVSNYFITWMYILVWVCSMMNIFPKPHHPDYKEIRNGAWEEVLGGKRIRIIIDSSNIRFETPGNAGAHSCMYSTYYKGVNAKFNLGISPNGTIIHVSLAYPGNITDKELTLHSLLAMQLLGEGQQVLADKGYVIHRAANHLGIGVTTPSFKTGSEQITTENLVKDRVIAEKRIHIERAVKRIKEWKILQRVWRIDQADILSEVLFVCGYLSNWEPGLRDTVDQQPVETVAERDSDLSGGESDDDEDDNEIDLTV